MIVIEDKTELFDIIEKVILEKKCISFTNTDTPNKRNKNSYIREHLNNNDTSFQTIISKITKYVSIVLNTNSIELEGFWINKITTETNKNDAFHKDEADITYLMYLNDNFTGGDYEYICPKTAKKEKIQPKKYLSIITTNDVEHRVKPVINGERYSIVFFYKFDKKIKKTLI